ncbi:hypothetical protein evm_006303 [Chilo suppressalis]|nr:hypothetical protein evm_006303 [Chilo suppressalis]
MYVTPSTSEMWQKKCNGTSTKDTRKIEYTRKTFFKGKILSKVWHKFGIPGVIECIDGTLVAMKKPAENEE